MHSVKLAAFSTDKRNNSNTRICPLYCVNFRPSHPSEKDHCIMSKAATTKKDNSNLDQNAICRAAKARRKNSPKKSGRNAVDGFTIRAAKQDRREKMQALKEQKQLGLTINSCIDAVFTGADHSGMCELYSTEKERFGDDSLPVPVRFSDHVRSKAQDEIADWCVKNPGKYEYKYESGNLILVNTMFIKQG